MTPHTIPQTVLFPDLFDKPLVATFNQEHRVPTAAPSCSRRPSACMAWSSVRPVSGRQTRTGEDSAHARGPDRPAGLRHRVRSSRWQRCRPLGRRPHPQAAARAGPGVRRALGVATHDLAIRERRAPQRALPDGARVGGVRHRTSSASPAGAGAAHHHRSDPTDDLTHGAQQLTLFNGHYGGWCYLPMLGFLSFDRGRSSIARRCCGPGRQWPPTGPSACCVGCSRCCGRTVSAGAVSRPARRGLCDPGDLRFPGCGAPARLRRGNGEERGVAAACGVRHAGGPRRRARSAGETAHV